MFFAYGAENMITLKFYPYAYVRVQVMKSLLLTREDYEKLLKMGPQEIIHYLQNKGYKEFSELSMKYSGIELLERALKQNLMSTYGKLKRISDEGLRGVIEQYLTRYDLFNMKTIARGIFTHQPKEEILNLLIPVGKYDLAYYEEIVDKRSLHELFAKLKTGIFKDYVTGMNLQKKNLDTLTLADLAEIETAFDKAYFTYILTFVSQIKKQGEAIKRLVYHEIINANILALMRLKRENIDPKVIVRYLIPIDPKFDALLQRIAETDEKETSINLIRKELRHVIMKQLEGEFDRALDDYKDTNTLVATERLLRQNALARTRTLSHTEVLSVNGIVSFIFSKEIEIKDIHAIYKGKVFGMDENVIRQLIII